MIDKNKKIPRTGPAAELATPSQGVEESTAVATAEQNTAVVSMDSRPSYVEASSGKGLNNIDDGDILRPRIKLLQGLSPEVASEGMSPGLMIDSITGQPLGSTVKLIFVAHNKSRRLFESIEKGGQVLCMSNDGRRNLAGLDCLSKCPHKHRHNDAIAAHQWNEAAPRGSKERKPACMFFYDFPAVMFNYSDPLNPKFDLIAFSCGSSKIKIAKGILTTLRRKINSSGQPYDIFCTAWEVSSKPVQSGQFKFFNFVAAPVGWPTEWEYKLAQKISDDLAKAELSFEIDREMVDDIPDDIDAVATQAAVEQTKF